MTETTQNLAVPRNASRSRMIVRRLQSRLLIAVVAVGIAAVAVFTPRTAASDSAEPTVSSDATRFEALSTMVAEQDAAARRAIESARRLTGSTEDDTTPAAELASAKVGAAASELLRPAKDAASTSAIQAESTSAASETRVIRMLVTAYCPCTKCCGSNAQGITASGKRVSYNQGRFVAADRKVLPFGTKLKIAGYHNAIPVEVTDTGSAIKGNRLDVYYPSHQRALEWGKRWVDVIVME